MKQKDIGIIIVIAIISSVFSIIISGAVFSTTSDRQQKVEVAGPISTDFLRPDPAYFNQSSINPAKLIQIGQDPDSKPFESQ